MWSPSCRVSDGYLKFIRFLALWEGRGLPTVRCRVSFTNPHKKRPLSEWCHKHWGCALVHRVAEALWHQAAGVPKLYEGRTHENSFGILSPPSLTSTNNIYRYNHEISDKNYDTDCICRNNQYIHIIKKYLKIFEARFLLCHNRLEKWKKKVFLMALPISPVLPGTSCDFLLCLFTSPISVWHSFCNVLVKAMIDKIYIYPLT